MSDSVLRCFIEKCKEIAEKNQNHSLIDKINCIFPEMKELISQTESWMRPEYLTTGEDSYARNTVYLDSKNELGLYVLVWGPGQWTPIHDHGTWGVVGVLQGEYFCEHNYIRKDNQDSNSHSGIILERGGSNMMPPGAMTSFVPNPDHIHVAGNPGKDNVVTLHLYGQSLAGFQVYDIDAGTRKWYKADQ